MDALEKPHLASIKHILADVSLFVKKNDGGASPTLQIQASSVTYRRSGIIDSRASHGAGEESVGLLAVGKLFGFGIPLELTFQPNRDVVEVADRIGADCPLIFGCTKYVQDYDTTPLCPI